MEGLLDGSIKSLRVEDVNVEKLFSSVIEFDDVSLTLKTELGEVLLGSESERFAQALADCEDAFFKVKQNLALSLGIDIRTLDRKIEQLRKL